ncbi:MAG: DEAD/DEAH box helicase [Aquamicrobium sp.]|uniref:DEAD/DEAH box helicase n=1 Tax=Aquamicrobium sp. TaxID=1872579 RepID=UPI00349E6888|nr:DEAD/DEAH box helicase [Aquamicrobium sp.]
MTLTFENTDSTAGMSSGFAALGLSGAMLKATQNAGFTEPKPIQVQAIPPQLEGRDILGIAQTGSGKTAAFSLPILAAIVGLGTKRKPRTARALILAPTRELAVQIEETIRVLAQGLHISTAIVLGGVSRGSQVRRIAPGVDILIATPGRLTDLVREGDLTLAETRWLVLDEADRMLDMGFINDVRRIARATHPERRTALFSATMPVEIEKLARELLKEPVRVEVAPQGTTAGEIRQSLVMARLKQKRKVLSDMLADPAMSSVIVFARTKHGADRVARDLERDGFEAAVIHGNKSQNARQKALNGFREGKVRILVATDIAARGIDVPGISHVVNFDLPDEAESYVHRIGRTGRNGADGIAVTLCAPDEAAKLRQVERIIRMKLPVAASVLDQPDPAPAKGAAAPRDAEGDAGRPRHMPGRTPRGVQPQRDGKPGQGKPFQKRPGGGRPFGAEDGAKPAGAKPAQKRPFRSKRRPARGRAAA